MILKHRFIPVLCFITLLAMAGCAQPPTDQINAATQAVKDAEQSGAATYLANDYAKIEAMIGALQSEVTSQDDKFALLRDYGKVAELAAAVKTEAERVKADAIKKMEEAKFAATQAHHAAQEAVQTTLQLVAQAPAGKDRAALEAIKSDADALKASINEVQMMLDKSDYMGAQTKAKAIQEKSQAVSQEIQTALAKIGKGKASPPKKK